MKNTTTHTSSVARAAICAAATIAVAAAPAFAQVSERAVFVANNGNLEGSVSSFTLNPDDSLNFVEKLVIGSRPNTQVYDPGTNAYGITITPNGRFLAVTHATSATDWEQLTIIEVHSDASMSLFATFLVRNSPLGVTWINDEFLAVTQTGLSRVWVYQFDPDVPSMTQIDFKDTGGFNSWLAIHPSRQFLYAQDSSTRNIFGFGVNPDGTLTPINTAGDGTTFPLGIGISPDGRRIYGGGGISNGGNKVIGANINNATGELSLMTGTPYISPGASPKQVVISSDNRFAAVAHGTDATIRMMAIDEATGALSDTGFMFDVGFQGSLGELEVMDDLLFATDRDTLFDGILGLYSFTINSDGSLTQNGPIVDTTGIGPNAIAAWKPAVSCPGDLNGDGVVDGQDLAILLINWCTTPGCAAGSVADLNGDGMASGQDLAVLLINWGDCP